MDSYKLSNILADLINETEQPVQETLAKLSASISSNQTNEITINVDSIRDIFSNSIVNKYAKSNYEIFKHIGGIEYFGNQALEKIMTILNTNSFNIQKTVTELQAYTVKRKSFLDLIETTFEGLKTLEITPHFYDKEIFEVGLLMPKELTHNKIVSVTKELNKWDKVFKTLKELTGQDVDDTEINFVSNGSLQFFIEHYESVAVCLAVSIDRVVKIYKNITEIRSTRHKLKELGISTSEQKLIEKQEKELLNSEFDKVATDLIKEFAFKQIEEGRLNELKLALRGHVSYIAKCIDGGMTIEIIPPEIKEPEILKKEPTTDNKDEHKKIKTSYDNTLKKISIVQKAMETFKEIGNIGLDITKLLTDTEDKESIK